MIKEMEKALKRYLKGKNRITTGVVVAFLLGSSFAFGDVTIKYDTAASTLIVQDDLGTNIGTVTKNPAGEFTWTLPEGANITETVKIDDTVNTNNIKVNIVNSGTISSSGTTGKSGNGLFSYSDTSSSIIGNITNSGNISGNSTGGDSSGNGIYACSDSYISISSSIIGNITNSGIISGSTTGSGNDSGNGIYSSSVNGDSTIGDITNSGIISGNGDASTSGNGIYSSSYSFDSYPESEIGNITNYGIISGSNSGRYNGNGIYSYSSTTNGSTKSKIDNITNYGIISGNNSSSAGHGIYLRSISGLAIIESISNYGVIMGSQNGIYVDGDSRSSSSSSSGITNYNNYGLVIGRTPVFVDKDGSGPNTFSDPEGQGMAITLESDGSIKTNGITSGTGGSTGIYSIVNTQLRDNLGSAVSSGAVDSYDVYTSDQSISDTIINGTGAKLTNGTVTINAGNFSLTNGIINAYKTAVTVNAGASFTGTDVTINGGGLDRTAPVISGDSGANTVNISGNSFINGKVD
uniref:beta strand repeat-containing protein n=1 Tax=Fusobacterium varium TaxID=856 RepID=UPI00356659DD